MTYPPRVPRLPSPKPYAPRSHTPMALIGSRCPLVLPAGLYFQPAPALPGGRQIKCSACRCSVKVDHSVDGDECRLLQQERAWKNAD